MILFRNQRLLFWSEEQFRMTKTRQRHDKWRLVFQSKPQKKCLFNAELTYLKHILVSAQTLKDF